MRRLHGVASLILGWLMAAGCMSPATPHKLTWRTLSRGLTSGLAEPSQQVIRDEGTYLRLWAQHAADIPRVGLPPAVDFQREMVVVVALGTQPTGGYLVEVVDAELRSRQLRILVGETQPQPGTFQIQQTTQPYQIIALPAVAAHVDFRTVRQLGAFSADRKARPGEEGPLRKTVPSPKPSIQPARRATP
ncbi:MAG: protease complex subunit PrcB family protein [Verrucomicrobiales bacterium]|nr:protease complex subunit PrcB family protein [Verrucomicrobiales bacterium]